MIRRLFQFMGLIKPSRINFFQKVEIMHEYLIDKILDERKISTEVYNRATCEINVFLFSLGIPIVRQHASPEFLCKYEQYVKENVIFKKLDTVQYSENYLSNFIDSRIAFHHANTENLQDQYKYDSYLFALDCLWSHEALTEVIDVEKLAKIACLRKGG